MSSVESKGAEDIPGNDGAQALRDLASGQRALLQFGLYEVDLQRNELRKGGLRLKLPRQSFQILVTLLKRPGEVVTRETLRQELWPDDVFVNFEGSLNSAVQKLRSVLQDTSRDPRYIETLPRVGYRFIADVESVIPVSDEAPQSAATPEPAEFPPDDTTTDEFSTVPPVEGRSRPRLAAAVFVLIPLLILFVVYAGYRYSRRNQQVPKAQTQPALVIPSSLTRRSVAVMGFTNVAGNARDAWLSTAFTEMLATELAAGDQLRTVAAEDVTRAKLELSLASEDSYAVHTLTKIHQDLGCDYVVVGSYLAIGEAGSGRVRLDARVQDALSGDTVASFAVVGSQSDLFDLASHAGEQLRAKLGVGALTSTEAEEVKLALPSNPEAARLYSNGLDKLRLYDDIAASDLFKKVIRLQPEYFAAYTALASARSALGYDAEAAVAARKAMELSQNLPQQARLQAEAKYHQINGDWTQAADIYAQLQRSYPDDLAYGLNHAFAQDVMGKGAEALATIAALRKLPAPERDDPRIDLMEARIAGDLGDFKQEQVLGESAAKKAELSGAHQLLARAKLLVGYASVDLGNFSKAKDAYTVAQQMYAESGDVVGAALAKMDIGIVSEQQGDIAEAGRSFEQVLPVFRKKGDQASLVADLNNLSEVYRLEGDLKKEEHLLRDAIVISNKMNRLDKVDIETGNLADSLQHQGRFREAKGILEPLVKHLRSTGKKSLLGEVIETLGATEEAQGDMTASVHMYQEAASLFKETGFKIDYAGAERFLGKALLGEADFVNAKQALAEALSVDREIGARAETALDQVALAEVASAQAGPVDMDALQAAIDELRLSKMPDDEIEAEIVAAREMMQEGRASEAARVLAGSAALSAKSSNPAIRFDVALATAHVEVAEHRLNDATRTVRSALRNAETMGCVRCQLEARLELGEIKIQSGNAEQGHAQLHELADEAGRRGFLLIARRAAAGQ
jgi:DNA-binding winged helix-turn-helix (wHTH) protein/tetratricopeptide (TPR) repeat protein